ncbi:MAG: NrsF family protein [Caulobacteraceae bacterium]
MNTDDLIAQLSASAAPVKRLAPPMTRALLWLAAVAALAAVPILLRSNLPVFAQRASDPRMGIELFATLATGVAGVIGAFHLSIPGRSRAWALLPLPFLLLWLVVSGIGCLEFLPEQNRRGWALDQGHHCFFFLLAVGLPMTGLLVLALRRAQPLQPRLVASVGALGAAGLAAFVLQFFHPFDVTVMDLGAHIAALALMIAAFSLSARISLAGRS